MVIRNVGNKEKDDRTSDTKQNSSISQNIKQIQTRIYIGM